MLNFINHQKIANSFRRLCSNLHSNKRSILHRTFAYIKFTYMHIAQAPKSMGFERRFQSLFHFFPFPFVWFEITAAYYYKCTACISRARLSVSDIDKTIPFQSFADEVFLCYIIICLWAITDIYTLLRTNKHWHTQLTDMYVHIRAHTWCNRKRRTATVVTKSTIKYTQTQRRTHGSSSTH